METVLYLLRHGITDSNEKGIWQCSIDEPLNERGREQVSSVIPEVAEIDPEVFVISTMLRTRQTAEILLGKIHPETIIFNPEMRERTCGAAEGMTSSQISERFGVEKMSIVSDKIDHIPGVEKRDDFISRVSNAMEAAFRDHQGKRILVVTHGGVIRGFYNFNVKNREIPRLFTNCSIIGMTKNSEDWQIVMERITER